MSDVPTMRVAVVPPISIGTAVERDRVLYAEVPRGCGLDDAVEIRTNRGGNADISGGELRCALLSASHPAPWKLGPVGAERYALQMDPDGRCSTIAHLDARGLGNPKYWLYRRGKNGSVHLTRWTRAGHIERTQLFEQAGIDADSLTKTAAKERYRELVAQGLPSTLQLTRTLGASDGGTLDAPDPGWLDVSPGELSLESERVPIHVVDDLGEWPGTVEQGSE